MTAAFSAIAPALKLADRVAQQLEEQIRAGRLHPGEKLPTEAELVRQLGVSRTVVREAVSRLHSRNLVEPRQGSGVYVKAAGIEPLDLDSLRQTQQDAVIQIAEVRRALEAEVAELAAQRRSADDLGRIHAAVAALAEAVRQGGDGVQEDVAFHRTIAQAAHNAFLLSTLDYLAQFLRGGTRVTRANEARRADFAEAVTAEHARIVAAIEAGDAAAARQAAAGHMSNAIIRIRQADAGFWQNEAAYQP
ncbi:FadR/GntR family transcriptional regulator [Acidovorax sp. MR-S7]|jgi:DNA-binding FadR family transcriptional regulator|uniref:FadR/GntR family transcriptional regulator n=1 Tax=Acidovorax sp. MR-S7 TaxID=1268622 RepID=UPI0003647FE5|nr:FadR/GntR family transcriptional regulator [Acidovorax sp. MR-S7]GAD22812.1 transcriptional regulator [Acidovorax sp. MR-S7]